MCGEVIFRGEECVSLGWCFWHRACYGCLLCGSRLICAGVPAQALFDDGDDDDDDDDDTEGGREVAEPPLCAVCVVEAELDGLDVEEVARRGLKRIERMDGGITRQRWEAKEMMKNQEVRLSMVTLQTCSSQ